ncbi:hypothetical protein BwSG20_16410 [Bradyrhizobium ottawaense]|nr:hypothetical protein BwSG20_16410 [Bradyrhizobium ottawaense]
MLSGLQGSGIMSLSSKHAGFDDALADLRQHDAVGIFVEILVAAGVLHRLQRDAAHACPGQRVADDVADLGIVDAALDGRDQRGRHAVMLEIFQRLLADFSQIRAAQVDQRVALQRIELEIDLQPAPVLGEPRHEILFAGDAQAVGVDHDVPDRAGAHRVQDREEIRMQRRFAAGDLHEIGLALACDQRVQHLLDCRERGKFRSCRRGFRKADRAGEVAVLGDLDQRQAGMLLVVGTETAIIGTAEFGALLELQRSVTWLDEILAQAPIGGIRRHQRRLDAMLPAALFVPDLVIQDLDLGRH